MAPAVPVFAGAPAPTVWGAWPMQWFALATTGLMKPISSTASEA